MELDPKQDPFSREAIQHLVVRYGSPLLVIDAERVRQQYRRLRAALPGVDLHYALKPLPHSSLITTLTLAFVTRSKFAAAAGCHRSDAGKAGFRLERYAIEPLPKTGEQGVDLIIASQGTRVAVQAKGYVGHPVGNGAVHELQAGKVAHGCQMAALVTNSIYTPSARELAERLHCVLIDGSQISDLIEGRIIL